MPDRRPSFSLTFSFASKAAARAAAGGGAAATAKAPGANAAAAAAAVSNDCCRPPLSIGDTFDARTSVSINRERQYELRMRETVSAQDESVNHCVTRNRAVETSPLTSMSGR